MTMTRTPHRDRGFTLLELGIVLGVIAILMAGSVVLTTGAVAAAKKERAATELRSYAKIAAGAFMRGVTVDHGESNPDLKYKFDGQNVSSTAPVCYDLSNSGWGGALPLTTPKNSVASMFVTATNGVVSAPNGGRNPYGPQGPPDLRPPYALCFYPHHAEVRTCVPTVEMATGLSNSSRCTACGANCPVACPGLDGQPYTCVVSSAPALPSRAVKIGIEYGALFEMPDTYYQ